MLHECTIMVHDTVSCTMMVFQAPHSRKRRRGPNISLLKTSERLSFVRANRSTLLSPEQRVLLSPRNGYCIFVYHQLLQV